MDIALSVYRRLDNRDEGLPDDSPRALELHDRRRKALHEAFDEAPGIVVHEWGRTDDSRPHELVELTLGAAASAAIRYAVVPGVKWLGARLAEKAVDTTLSEVAKAVVARLRPKQESEEILDFTVTLPDGTRIRVDPPARGTTMTVTFGDGSDASIEISSGEAGEGSGDS